MKHIFLWTKRNYVNFNFVFGLITVLVTVISHLMELSSWKDIEGACQTNEVMRWILYYCIVQHSVVLLVDLYKLIVKKQYKEKLFCIAKGCFSFYLVLMALMTYYHNLNLGQGYMMVTAIMALFLTVSKAIRDK